MQPTDFNAWQAGDGIFSAEIKQRSQQMSLQMHVADAGPAAGRGKYKHFQIERPGRIMVIGGQLKVKTRYQCLLRHISLGGAMLDFNAVLALPRQFFLEIDGMSGEIGCSEVHRKGCELGVRFNIPLAQDFLSRLIRLEFMSGAI